MKRLPFLILWLLFSVPLLAQRVQLERMEQVRVWLFSDIDVAEIRLSPKNSSFFLTIDSQKAIEIDTTDWIRVSKKGSQFWVVHQKKATPARSILIESDGVGLINVVSEQSGYRYYRGRLEMNAKTGIRPLNTISLEDYVASVVGSEMNFTHPEALKVQAVISRTYALWTLGTTGKNDWYDLTDHTMNQVYNGELIEKPWYRDAALATSGEIATFNDKVILAVFSSTCGGHTSDNETTWKGKPLPYLRGISDHDACKRSPHFNWRFALPQQQWDVWFQRTYPSFEGMLRIKDKTSDGRVAKIGTSSSSKSIKANDFRLKVIREFGTRSLKSTFFEIDSRNDSLIFIGRGMGHGIGVCQWGALGLAESGWKYKDILRFYYGGIEIKDVYFAANQNFLELAN